MDLQEAVRDYLERDPIELGLSRCTVGARKGPVVKLLHFLEGKEFTLENVRDFLFAESSRGLEPSTVHTVFKTTKAFCHFCFRRKYITENWGDEIQLPKRHHKPVECLPAEVCERIIMAGTQPGDNDRANKHKQAKIETRMALRFCIRTGLRMAELIALKGSDLRFDEGTFLVNSKGGNIDVMPLPVDMIDELKTRADRARVFEIRRETCNFILKRGAKALGITTPMHVHVLRHSFATTLLRAGTSPAIVQRLLRHRSIEVTNDVYSHYILSDLSNVLNSLNVIQNGLTTDEVLDSVEELVKKRLGKDARFCLTVERDGGEFVLKVKPAHRA